MLKLTTTDKTLPANNKKFCRLVLTEAPVSSHRLVETANGSLEYRLGAGKWSKINPRAFRTLLRSIVQTAKSHEISHLAITITPDQFPKLSIYSSDWFYSTVAENILIASYEFTNYKTILKKKNELTEVLIANVPKSAKKAIERGKVIGTYVNHARDIANMSGDDMTPEKLGTAAAKMARKVGVRVTIHNHAAIKKLGMGLLDAVGKGANDEPKFIVMEYQGNKKKGVSPIVLIGKGVTYDTGGLNVKPTGAMHDMHLDMSGGASVIAAICAAAVLKLPKNIVALIPAAENAVSDRSMRAGDIVKSLSGQTVEILHTDAEGRLILADALTYAARLEPRVIIDVATLTGASLIALGQHASALMTKNKALSDKLFSLGEETGDLVWPLPLWEEYRQYLKSHRADVSNISTSFAKWGGAIEGGAFLSFFAPKKVPWAHLDIAPRMDSIPSDKLAKGSTGEPVRLLVAFLERYE